MSNQQPNKPQQPQKPQGAPQHQKQQGQQAQKQAPQAAPKPAAPAPKITYPPRLRERYRNEIAPEMMKVFGYKNRYQVPSLQKIVINVGLGEASQDIKLLDSCQDQIAAITGQKPVVTKAKKAIANFKIRKGSAIGCKVTLRRAVMYEFLDRLISVAIPRIRDFRGLPSNSFDQHGNYSFGLNEQSIFPEIDADKIMKVHGMDITIVTSAKTAKEASELLKLFGMPFAKKQ